MKLSVKCCRNCNLNQFFKSESNWPICFEYLNTYDVNNGLHQQYWELLDKILKIIWTHWKLYKSVLKNGNVEKKRKKSEMPSLGDSIENIKKRKYKIGNL